MEKRTGEPLIKQPSLRNLLKFTAQAGLAGSKVFLTVVVTFGFVNFLLTAYALFKVFMVGFSWATIGLFCLVVLLTLGFTALACYFTYRYLIRRAIQHAYRQTLEQRMAISEEVIRQVEHSFNSQQTLGYKPLDLAVDWSKIVYRHYQRVPVFFQSGITQYLNRIPISNYVIDLKSDILSGNASSAAEKLRISMDTFLEEHVLGSPSNRWTWWLLLLNILVLYTLITWGIGIS